MRAGIINAGGWQTHVDMKSGRQISLSGYLPSLLSPILESHRYPGDRDSGAIPWVTDVAQEIVNAYEPEFLMLAYATPYFLRFNEGMEGNKWREMISELLDHVSGFCEIHGYHPVIVGTGAMIKHQGIIDLTGLSGLADAGGPVHHLAAIMEPSDQDLNYLHAHPHVSGVYSREEILETFQMSLENKKDIPDLLVIAKPGYTFKALGSCIRPYHFLPGQNEKIPISGLDSSVHDITDISGGVLRSLESEKTALIIIEGLGTDDLPCRMVSNSDHWYRYTMSCEQYLAIMTGKHISSQPWPPGYRGFIHDGMKKAYPFSGIIDQIPHGTIGEIWAGKSAAVGTRSVFTHVSSGADITIECKVCNQYNHGTMAIFSEKGISQQE